MSCGNSSCIRNVLLVSYLHSSSCSYTDTGKRHYYCCGMEVRKRIKRERMCVRERIHVCLLDIERERECAYLVFMCVCVPEC